MNRNKKKHFDSPPEAVSTAASGAAFSSMDAENSDETTRTEVPGPATLQQELDASRNQYLRLMADFDNFRKRVARERTELIKRASEETVTELLPILDHFELALQQATDPADPFVAGVRMVYEQLVATLGKNGLNSIQTTSQPFDPAVHDAIAYQPSTEVDEGYVLIQTRCGYRIGDHVIRPASVIVSSGQPKPAAADDSGNPAEAPGAVDGAEAPLRMKSEENYDESENNAFL